MHTNRIVPRVRTAIVGGGPSTSSLLANVIHPRHDRKPSDCDFNVVRLHPNDSMWKKFPSDFEMGQSSTMLVAPPYQRDQPHQRFLKVEQFNRYMDRRDNENLAQMEAADIRATVLKIKKFAPNDFQVVYQDYQSGDVRELKAQNVYFSPGPRSERSIVSEVPYNQRSSRLSRAFAEYTGAVSVLTSQVLIGSGGVVGIVGDGPTALWTAKIIADMGNDIVLLGPDTPSAFGQSNPGGRNNDILRTLGEDFYVGTILGIEEREVSNRADWEEPGTTLVVKDYRPHDFKTRGRTAHLPLSAIVSAIGPTLGFSSVIDPALEASLSVVPGASALATENEDFLLFGSGAYYHAKFLKQAISFDEAGKRINQPPVGIAAIEMSAQQLSRSLKDSWKLQQDPAIADLHPPTVTGQQISDLIRKYGVDPRGTDEMTRQILTHRETIARKREYTDRDFAEGLQQVLNGKSLVESGPSDRPNVPGGASPASDSPVPAGETGKA